MDFATIQPLLDWLTEHPTTAGLFVAGVAAVESLALVGIVVPGVVFMIGVGALVGLGTLPLWSTLLWAGVGAIIGDGVSYWLGHHYETQLRHVWPLSRYPKLVPRGELFFKKHGSISVFFGRFIGPIRPIIPAVAGIMKMPPVKFYTINILSAVLWAPVVILPGVAVGASYHLATAVAARFAILVVILLLLLWFTVWLLGRISKYIVIQTTATLVKKHWATSSKPVYIVGSFVFLVILWGGYEWKTQNGTEEYYKKYSNIDKALWWEDQWQNVLVNEVSNSATTTNINMQWWGSISRITQVLDNNGWAPAKQLDIKNAVRWLVPEPQTKNMPLLQGSLHGFAPKLHFVYNDPNNNVSIILRLWSTQKQINTTIESLWLGSLVIFQFERIISNIDVPRFTYVSETFDSDLLPVRQLTNQSVIIKNVKYTISDESKYHQKSIYLLMFNTH